MDKIQFSTQDELYLLGDYIDRGPNSKGVIDLIWKMQAEGYFVKCLRGNHEQILLDLINAPNHFSHRGDEQLLASFGVYHARYIPQAYLKWCDQLPYFFEVDNYLLVHAGFDFNTDEPLREIHAMMWIRNWRADIDRRWLKGRIVVNGHTPTPRPAIELYLETITSTPQLVIDNGCVFHGRRAGLGALCAFELTSKTLYFEEYIG